MTLKKKLTSWDFSKVSWRDYSFYLMSAAVIQLYLVIIWFMMSFFDDLTYSTEMLCRAKMYVLSTASSTIVLSAASMLLWLSCMQQASAWLYHSCKWTALVACARTCAVPTGSTGALYVIGKIVAYRVSQMMIPMCPWFTPPSLVERVEVLPQRRVHMSWKIWYSGYPLMIGKNLWGNFAVIWSKVSSILLM